MDFKLHNGSGSLCLRKFQQASEQLNAYTVAVDFPETEKKTIW